MTAPEPGDVVSLVTGGDTAASLARDFACIFRRIGEPPEEADRWVVAMLEAGVFLEDGGRTYMNLSAHERVYAARGAEDAAFAALMGEMGAVDSDSEEAPP